MGRGYKNEKKIDVKELESEIPFGLKRIGILIDAGVNFYEALRIISEEEGCFPEFIREIISKTNNGLSFDEAMRSEYRKYKSDIVLKTITKLIIVNKTGERGEKIRRIANEMVFRQEHEIKKYASKTAVFGLLFVVLSIIIPTSITIFYFIGNMAIGINITGLQYQIILLVLLPFINLLLLFIMRMSQPKTTHLTKDNRELWFLGGMLVLSIITLLIGYIGIVIMLIVGTVFIYSEYKKDKNIENLESEIPEFLIHLSSMEGQSIEKIVMEIANSKYKIITQEFRKTLNQIKSKMTIEKVFYDLKKRNKSKLFDEVVVLIEYVFESGEFKLFSEMAQDVYRYFEIKREKMNLMSMQKYTLILGSVLLPIILNITTKMSNSMQEIFNGGGNMEIIYSTIPIYLIIYGIMAGHHITEIEEYKSKGMIYTLAMIMVGLVLYFIMLKV